MAVKPKPKPVVQRRPVTIYIVEHHDVFNPRSELRIWSLAGEIRPSGDFLASERSGTAFSCRKLFGQGEYDETIKCAIQRFRERNLDLIETLEAKIEATRRLLEVEINTEPKPSVWPP